MRVPSFYAFAADFHISEGVRCGRAEIYSIEACERCHCTIKGAHVLVVEEAHEGALLRAGYAKLEPMPPEGAWNNAWSGVVCPDCELEICDD